MTTEPALTDVPSGRRAAAEHRPSIQPHGVLMVLDPQTLTIEHVSANLAAFLGVAPSDALGRPLDGVLPDPVAALVRHTVAEQRTDTMRHYRRVWITGADGDETPFVMSVHRWDRRIVLELEPGGVAGDEPDSLDAAVATFRAALLGLTNSYDICRATVEAVMQATHYDRVLTYRFMDDWSGEVIAELRRIESPALLGLRFPAADIPDRTRMLYHTHGLRLIVDSNAAPVPLIPPVKASSGQPVTLDASVLRAVSEQHLLSLRTLDVAASIIGALVVEGRIWGLVACHNETPRMAEIPVRIAVRRIIETAAQAIEAIERPARQAEMVRTEARLAHIRDLFSSPENAVRALLFGDQNLIEIASADGVAVIADGWVATFGQTPEADQINRVMTRIEATGQTVFITECLGDHHPEAAAFTDTACGMMAAILSRDPLVGLAAFRRETIREEVWCSRPDHRRQTDPQGDAQDFEPWREVVTGHCRPWDAEERTLWSILPDRLGDALGSTAAAAGRLMADLKAFGPLDVFQDPAARALVNALPGGVLVSGRLAVHDVYRTITVNHEFCNIFRLAPEDIRDRPVHDVLARLGLRPMVVGLKPGRSMETALDVAGVPARHFSVSRRPLLKLRTDGVDCALSLWLFEDITRFRRVEEALRAARDNAMVASRAKSEFLAGMSHELRTPLNAIIGFSEVMAEELFGPLGNPKYQRYVKDIRDAGEHLLGLIGGILDISKIEAGGRELDEEVIDLDELIGACCALMEDQARRAEVVLMQDLAPMARRVTADARALRQILLNLLSNAIKFTQPGGTVICRTLMRPSEAIALEVQDDGIGIPSQQLERIFDPFFQAHGPYTRRAGGTGLGLALVKSLSELHGARVSVSSEPGRGTTVRVTFPAWRSAIRVAPAES